MVPAYNEAENLPILVSEIRKALSPASLTYEILLVDDASTDASPGVMDRLAAANDYVRVIRHERNLGQSAALATAFERIRAPVVITLDANLQNDPDDIPRLLDQLEDCDVVCGIRAKRQDKRSRNSVFWGGGRWRRSGLRWARGSSLVRY
ncbi:MAG: glycosyltransferase [bacterium]|nr:glycosyltransferase [bacterium]